MSNLDKYASDIGLLWLRVAAGLGIAYHGYGKVFGGQIEMLQQGVAGMGFPFPAVFAWAAALSEFAGGICLTLGLFTQVAAFFVFFTMSVAFFVAHKADPFHVKELAFLYWTISASLIFAGGGKWSVERIFKK